MMVEIRESTTPREKPGASRRGFGVAVATAVFFSLSLPANGIMSEGRVCDVSDPRCAPKHAQTQTPKRALGGHGYRIQRDSNGREVAVCTPFYGAPRDPAQITEDKGGKKKEPEKKKGLPVSPAVAILLGRKETDVLPDQDNPNPHPTGGSNGNNGGNGKGQSSGKPSAGRVKAPE